MPAMRPLLTLTRGVADLEAHAGDEAVTDEGDAEDVGRRQELELFGQRSAVRPQQVLVAAVVVAIVYLQHTTQSNSLQMYDIVVAM